MHVRVRERDWVLETCLLSRVNFKRCEKAREREGIMEERPMKGVTEWALSKGHQGTKTTQ